MSEEASDGGAEPPKNGEDNGDAAADASATERASSPYPDLVIEGGNNVFNVWNGEFLAAIAELGISGAEARRPLTGPVEEEDVADALRCYVRPPDFGAAQDALRNHRLVILDGPEGIGKHAGALALLDREATPPIVALSPGWRTEELRRYEYRSGRGYVVQDWTVDDDRQSLDGFSLRALRAEVARKHAFLVITTTQDVRRGSLDDFAVRWSPPASKAVVASYVDGLDLDSRVLERIEERFAGCRTPRTIARFAARLVGAGTNSDDINRVLDESQADEVARCFDDDPDVDWVMFVAALAFLHGVPETLFEHALERLEQRVFPGPAPAADSSSSDQESEAEPRPTRALDPTRLTRSTLPLVEIRDELRDHRDARRLVFASAPYRARVLAELWRRYDRKLWEPLSAWIDELAASGNQDVQLSLSLGLALLADVAGPDVRARHLEAWAGGGESERIVVSYTVWWLAMRDASAPYALSMATSWAQGRSAERKTTAILCLSGQLGVRFPKDALRWLWHLANADEPTAVRAQRAIAVLFCACIAGDEPDTVVLSFLAEKIRKARRPRSRVTAGDVALLAVTLVLGIRIDEKPATAVLLGADRHAAETLGDLWAEVLVNRRFRGAGLAALREALRTLHRADDKAAIAALGNAIVQSLPTHELALLKGDLLQELTSPGEGRRDAAQSILDALLADAGATTPDGNAPPPPADDANPTDEPTERP